MGNVAKYQHGWNMTFTVVELLMIIPKSTYLSISLPYFSIYHFFSLTLSQEIAYLNQRVGNIKILNKSSLFPDYRNIYMQSKVDEILKIAYGGAQPNISASVIGNFDFPLPPYKEQIRIVETVQRIFDQLDTITESL